MHTTEYVLFVWCLCGVHTKLLEPSKARDMISPMMLDNLCIKPRLLFSIRVLARCRSLVTVHCPPIHYGAHDHPNRHPLFAWRILFPPPSQKPPHLRALGRYKLCLHRRGVHETPRAGIFSRLSKMDGGFVQARS